MEFLEQIIPFLPVIATSIISVTGLWISFTFQKFNKGLANDKLNKELFTELNARYDKLNDSLVIIETYYKHTNQFKELSVEDRGMHQKLKQDVIDFFNLCAEEYYWHKKRRIDPKVWEAWYSGMNYWVNEVETIRELWIKELETNGRTSYYLGINDDFFALRHSS